jgi:hypothetical protein
MMKESTEEIIGREAESVLEKGRKHHNFIGIGCGKIFTSSGMSLQHDMIQEKVTCNELTNLAFICNRHLKQVQVRGSHGREEDSLRQGIEVSEETEIARKMMRNGGGMRSDEG